MKTKLITSFLTAALSLTMAGLIGCASSKSSSSNTVSSLAQAGFVYKEPKTAEQKEIFARLPAYKVQIVQYQGQSYYVYKNEAKGYAMVGHEAEYQRYRQIARQDRLAASQYNAEMASAADMNSWYGASGSDWWH